MNDALRVDSLSKRFGGIQAVSEVSFSVSPGEAFGVIGPNGAGKTTLFNIIAGTIRTSSGSIEVSGARIERLPTFKRARLGLARTFQRAEVFPELTVRQNLAIASLHAEGGRLLWPLEELLDTVGLTKSVSKTASRLTVFERQRLAIGMGLAGAPQVLLLDEPSGGLVESEVRELTALLRRLSAQGLTLVVIDHKMKMIMEVCDRILVMMAGRELFIGTPAEVTSHPEVITAYLGQGALS